MKRKIFTLSPLRARKKPAAGEAPQRAAGSRMTIWRTMRPPRLTRWRTMRRRARRMLRRSGGTKFLRLQAEFDNYRKRTLREKMELVETGGKKVLLAMLPVRDDVQRALAAMGKSDDAAAIREGVELIAQKFTESLRQQGVTEIAALDAPFDPDLHEAVAKFAAGEEKRGRVIDVVQAGYMLGDKVLRFAKVVVGE